MSEIWIRADDEEISVNAPKHVYGRISISMLNYWGLSVSEGIGIDYKLENAIAYFKIISTDGFERFCNRQDNSDKIDYEGE